jgi:hypothetical protein
MRRLRNHRLLGMRMRSSTAMAATSTSTINSQMDIVTSPGMRSPSSGAVFYEPGFLPIVLPVAGFII